jgi:integrase
MAKSSKKARPSKPRPDFPLFPHATGRWCKKVRGSFAYFGKVADDPKGERALELWREQKDDLLAGRRPRAKADNLTVEDLCDQYLDSKRARIASGELKERTWNEYRALLRLVADTLGRKRAADDILPAEWESLRAEFAKRWGAARLSNAVMSVRGTWRWGWQNSLLSSPMRFGSGFGRAPAKVIRSARSAAGSRMFEPEQLRNILQVADPNFRCMLLLGINAGLGNTDLAYLPVDAINATNGWLNYPRRKTGVARRVPLWPQTLEAVREVLAQRPTPRRGCEKLLFLQGNGQSYAGMRGNAAIGKRFSATAKAANVEGRSFYDLRRTFLTVGERAKDPVAVSAIMGHAAGSKDMSAVYRQSIDDERLQAVVDVVRTWLFGDDRGPG